MQLFKFSLSSLALWFLSADSLPGQKTPGAQCSGSPVKCGCLGMRAERKLALTVDSG